MAENQILPFAYADGANVLSQSDYQADNQRLIGHQPGIARSALENKALRQATTIAAGLAQFIADGQAADVTDAKTPVEIAAMLAAANLFATPYATTTDPGKVRLATDLESQEQTTDGGVLTARKLAVAFGGANTLREDNGYQKLPNGLIIQWGAFETGASSAGGTATFPIAFPSKCLGIAVAHQNNSVSGGYIWVRFTTTTAVTCSSSTAQAAYVRYIAIGH